MKIIFKIARSELNSLFYSPIAWLVLVIYTFQLSFGFTGMLNEAMVKAVMGEQLSALTSHIFINGFGSPLFQTVVTSLFLYVPLLTMGIMSKEYSSGSVKLLLSSPVTEFQVILGKYLSMLAYGMIMMFIIGVYIVFGTFVIKDLDLPLLISGVFSIYLLFCFYAAIGLFFSCITSYQIVAALGAIITIFFFQFIGTLFQTTPIINKVTFWMSSSTHGMVTGLLSSDHVIYYVLFISMFVIWSILNLRFQRKNLSVVNKAVKYIGVFLITVTIGYITSRQQAICYWDVTRFKQNTLTPKSQEILSHIEGEPELTAYVNYMGNPHFVTKAFPENVNTDKLAFRQYTRFMPGMKINYVYYYGDVHSHHSHGKGSNNEYLELVKKTAKINSIDFDEDLTGGKIRGVIDPAEEESGFVRTFKVPGLPEAYIRMYNSSLVPYPGENEISTALNCMLEGSVKIGFITGHGEPSLVGKADRDYCEVIYLRSMRSSLINKGFKPLSLSLDKPIPGDIDIIVIGNSKVAFSDDEFKHIESYVERGGNLVIATDINRNSQMEPLLRLFGVEAVPGILAQENQGYPPVCVFTYFTENSSKINSGFNYYIEKKAPVIMPGSVGLIKTTDKGYDAVPVLEARMGTWNVTSTSNPDEIVVDPVAASNAHETYNTALALTKNRGGKEQRILIFGDTNWLSKGEINAGRSFLVGNRKMITNMFKWMCYDKYPMSFDRPALPDNELYYKYKYKGVTNFFFLFFLPFIWLGFGGFVWYKRRRK